MDRPLARKFCEIARIVIARHPWFEGTDTKALEVFIDLQRKMTVQEKVLGVFSMNEMLCRTAEALTRTPPPRS